MKNIILKYKNGAQALLAAMCIFLAQNTNAYTIKSTTLCGDTCTLHRNNNLYMVFNASVISPTIHGTYSFREGYGKNVYYNHPDMYGIFIGTNFNDRLGMEIGYETQRTKKRLNKVTMGEPLPGHIIIDPNDVVFIQTSARTEHFQVLLKVRLNEIESKSKVNLWGQVGASYSQLRASQNILYVIDGGPPLAVWNVPVDLLSRTFKSKKLIPVIKLGTDCNITENLSVRGSVGWRNLRLLRAKSNERPDTKTEIKLRDEYNIAIGLVYRFW